MDRPIPYCNPEVWGGIECTINRVKNEFIDQLQHSGHYYREGDLEKLCDLGIKKMRYPLLWEKHQPEKDAVIDWSWSEKQLGILKERNVDVIAGLVHHGSGPAFTNLADENFPYLLASYAAQVAEKFPWIEYYTPVNEPLTTARFSGLYGIWYPHHSDTVSFMRMLLNQLKGVVLAMKEIRKINPAAKLVQTEDLSKTYSTPGLQYQAKFENERRWLTFDLLMGRFDENHALWDYFIDLGLPEKEFRFFLENPCPPDIFGFNHYLTSERYLDERLERYPAHTHGGNGLHKYADVEAVRVNFSQPSGLAVLLREAWERYQRPMAITEVHLHCHREEQLRWFRQVWQTIARMKEEEAIDIKAVTSWAMLGSYGWNQLLTRPDGDYEPGVFDLRNGYPRPTALASYVRTIANGGKVADHLSDEKGWWERESRWLYETCRNTVHMPSTQHAPLLVIGKNGRLGRAFARICQDRCLHHYVLGRQDCNLSATGSIEAVIERYRPWAIINAAGYTKIESAETRWEECHRDNTVAAQNLAAACQRHGIRLLSFSSDLVFDGRKSTAYVESDLPNPLNAYGRSKAQAELLIQKSCSSSLILRAGSLFGPWEDDSMADRILRALLQYEPLQLPKDVQVSLSYIPHLVHAALDLIIDGETGIWHMANKGATSWVELAFRLASDFRLDTSLILPTASAQMDLAARRPFNSVLGTEKGQHLPSLESALADYYRNKEAQGRRVA